MMDDSIAKASMCFDKNAVLPYTLPDFTSHSTAEWECNERERLRKLFATEMYGEMPPSPPEISFVLLNEKNDALHGKAVRKIIRIQCGKDVFFDMLLHVPKKVFRPPVFLGLNFYGNHTTTAEDDIPLTAAPVIVPGSGSWFADGDAALCPRGAELDNWSTEYLIDCGTATATIYYGEIFPDTPDGFDRSIYRLFHTPEELSAPRREFGAISAWAWGLMRGMDALRQEVLTRECRVIVHGHSRLGKTALWAAANDRRFAGVISNNSGCCGAALSKHRFGENLEYLLFWRKYWFTAELQKYIAAEDKLPMDQHQLLALAAPRPLYVASASEDYHADPEGEHLSWLAAQDIYRLYGCEGRCARHLRPGGHGITSFDWRNYVKWAKNDGIFS